MSQWHYFEKNSLETPPNVTAVNGWKNVDLPSSKGILVLFSKPSRVPHTNMIDLAHTRNECAPEASSLTVGMKLIYGMLQVYSVYSEPCHPNRPWGETGNCLSLLPTLPWVHSWQQFINIPLLRCWQPCCFRITFSGFIRVSYLLISACCCWRPQSSVHNDTLMR